MSPDTRKPEVYKWIRTAGLLSIIPFVLASGPLAGYFLGEFLVKRFSLPVYALYISITIGFLGSISETIRIIKFALLSEDK